MITNVRAQRPKQSLALMLGTIGAFALSVGLGGCSKPSVDGPTWSLTGSREVAPPIPPEPVGQTPVYRGGRDPSTGRAMGDAAPPHVVADVKSSARGLQPTYQAPGKSGGVTMAALAPPSNPITKTPDGRTIVTVQPGETLTGIAAAHRVSISGIMFANNLRNPTVVSGQKLVLPPR
jgi:LysM domain